MPENPFASPEVSPQPSDHSNAIGGRESLVKFQRESRALGVLWIFLGVLCSVAAVAIFGLLESEFDLTIFIVITAVVASQAAINLALGVGCLFRQMWAVWGGLVYGSLIVVISIAGLAIGSGNLCGILFYGAGVLQSYRLTGYAKDLKARGISLHSKV